MFRAMRRHAQQLERSECDRILLHQSRGVLSVLGDEGYPYGMPLNYVYDDESLLFHCARQGHKLDALDSCDKASFCVLDDGVQNEGEWWLCFKSVIAFGRVSRVTDKEEIRHALHLLADKYFPQDYDTESDIARNLGQVVILRLSIEHLSGKAVREK